MVFKCSGNPAAINVTRSTTRASMLGSFARGIYKQARHFTRWHHA
ncbi:hypothetical protein O9929_17355 [Vibrio lentus]|nr:hypothetical protein [Vibrio lentus]